MSESDELGFNFKSLCPPLTPLRLFARPAPVPVAFPRLIVLRLHEPVCVGLRDPARVEL